MGVIGYQAMSPLQTHVKLIVDQHPEGVTAAEVEEILEKPRGWALKKLNRLAKLGLVRREEEVGPVRSKFTYFPRRKT